MTACFPVAKIMPTSSEAWFLAAMAKINLPITFCHYEKTFVHWIPVSNNHF